MNDESISSSARLRPDRLATLFRITIGESIRSKRFIMLALLQTLGGALAMLVFVKSVTALEEQLGRKLELDAPEEPGALLAELMHSPEAQDLLRNLAGETTGLSEISPLALMVGATLGFTLPLLLLFIVAPTLAAEIGSGAGRYALVRVTRLEWVLGRFLGELAIGAVLGLLLMGVLLGIGLVYLPGLSAGATLVESVVFFAIAFLLALPYGALALLASQITRGAAAAVAVSLFLLFGTRLVDWAASSADESGLPAAIGVTLRFFVPASGRSALFAGSSVELALALASVFGLSILFVLAGFAVLRERDL
jgi:ABC-type transport system involved in multi-copper enzyme maturation permease subunit